MLETTNKDAAYCYRRAEDAQRRAQRATNPDVKKDYEYMEIRWLGLARSYDFAARLNAFFVSQRLRKQGQTPEQGEGCGTSPGESLD